MPMEREVDCGGANSGAPAMNGFAAKASGELGHREAPRFSGTPQVWSLFFLVSEGMSIGTT